MRFCWEGESWEINPIADRQSVDFVTLCEQLGESGRSGLIAVLAINHTDELKQIINQVAASGELNV